MVKSYETVQPVPFGSYQLVERLAMGGMAEVYLARPDGQQRFVALKRILPNIAADDEFIAMFIDEAKIAGQLNHPNVAQIFDLGKINNSYFIAMEYVSGHDVRALWDRTRDADNGKPALPLGLACYMVKKICDGLDYAHRRRDGKGRPLGIIHRDVSPQNILVSYEGDLKIIDFGIAKAANRIVKTQTGILKGKFAYMAPEQARGEPTDHRADIFAIGVILYELLTGERTFKADSDFALLEKVRRVEMPAPRSLRPEIPKDLERIIYKALAKEAADRYAWASALGSDLDRFMSDQGYASSKEELGAFLQRTFREEFKEEQRRLKSYRSLFEEDDASSSALTNLREGPVSLDSESNSSDGTDGTDVGASVQSDQATSFEDGGPTNASDVKKVDKPGAKNGAKERNANGAESTAQIMQLRERAAKIAAGEASQSQSSQTSKSQSSKSQSSKSQSQPQSQSQSSKSQAAQAQAAQAQGERSSMMASLPDHGAADDDDDDIDASEEASAVGAALGSGATASLNTGGRFSNSAPVDETQLDPDMPNEPVPAPSPPSIVSRDEMPKRLRVVSVGTSNSGSKKTEPPVDDKRANASAGPDGARNTLDDRSQSSMLPARDERSAVRDERSQSRSGMNGGERSSLSRAQPSPPQPHQRAAVGPILVSALLGAVIGAGVVAIGWLASKQPTSTVMFVATPRQTEVRLGDEVLCAQTPCAVLLEPGKHEVRFKAPGAEQLSRTVEVKADGTAPVEVVLERARGDVRLETQPPGATVTVDDRALPGTTPMTLPRLIVGASVRLKILREGFEPLEVSRAVDDEPVWRYELPTSTTTWTISADPDDAQIDGPGREAPNNKLLVIVATKKSAQVKVSRPGCTDRTIPLVATGKPDAEQKIQLDCKKLDAGLYIRVPRGARVWIDDMLLPKAAKLEPYRLPSGTTTVRMRSTRGKTEVQTMELKSGELPTLVSKLK